MLKVYYIYIKYEASCCIRPGASDLAPLSLLASHKCSWAVLAVRRVILVVRAACVAGVALVQTHSCNAAEVMLIIIMGDVTILCTHTRDCVSDL
jgi:hypothetical protein